MKVNFEMGGADKQAVWWEYMIYTNTTFPDVEQEAAAEKKFSVEDIPDDDLPFFLITKNFLLVQPSWGDIPTIVDIYEHEEEEGFQEQKDFLNVLLGDPSKDGSLIKDYVAWVIKAAEKLNGVSIPPITPTNLEEIEEVKALTTAATVLRHHFPDIWFVKADPVGGNNQYQSWVPSKQVV